MSSLADQLRVITNPQEFVGICNAVLSSKYPLDYQVVDGTTSDEGCDGYIRSEKTLIQIHCPVKPLKATNAKYKEKIKTDLIKASELNKSSEFSITKWVFLTPDSLQMDVLSYLYSQAKEYGFDGVHIESTFLANEFTKNPHLTKQYPSLNIISLDDKIDKLTEQLIKKESLKQNSVTSEEQLAPIDKPQKSESDDDKEVKRILSLQQTIDSKSRLKVIFYKSSDPIARLNAISGLIHWRDPIQESDDDMIELCNQALAISDQLKSRHFKSYYLARKGEYLSSKWSSIDMNTAFEIKVSNQLGVPIITEQQRQEKIKLLYSLEEQFSTCFKEAANIALDLKNPVLIAQICSSVGYSAGGRYIHLSKLSVGDRAEMEKLVAKRMLLHAKQVCDSVKDELGGANVLHSLTICLSNFGENQEALGLNQEVIRIAEKYNDQSLLQVALWLKESLKTGKIPDYVNGERRPLKV